MLHHRLRKLPWLAILLGLCLFSNTLADELVFGEEKIQTAVGTIAVPDSLSKPREQALARGAKGIVATGYGSALMVNVVEDTKPLTEARARQIVEAFVSGFPQGQREKTRVESVGASSLPVNGSFLARILTSAASGGQRESGVSISVLRGKLLVIMGTGFDEQQFKSILKTLEPSTTEVETPDPVAKSNDIAVKGEILERQLKDCQPYALLAYGVVIILAVLLGRARGRRLSYAVGLIGFFLVWAAFVQKATDFAASLGPEVVKDDHILAFLLGFSLRALLLAAVAQIIAWKLFLPKKSSGET